MAECLDHAHQNGLLHLNLHPGNVLYSRCAERDEEIGFFVTDFGKPFAVSEDSVWTEQHEKVFDRLKLFYPPHLLAELREFSVCKSLEERR